MNKNLRFLKDGKEIDTTQCSFGGCDLTFKEAIVCFSLKMIRTKEARSFLGFHLKHSHSNLNYAE